MSSRPKVPEPVEGPGLYLELRDEFPASFGCPHFAVFAGGVRVFAVECAPLHGEARIDSLVVVANVLAAGVFFGLFATSVGEFSVCTGLAVVLKNPVAGAASELWRAEVVAHADRSHPCDRQSFVLGHVNHLVHGREHHYATQAVLEVLRKRIREHGSETEPDGEHA